MRRIPCLVDFFMRGDDVTTWEGSVWSEQDRWCVRTEWIGTRKCPVSYTYWWWHSADIYYRNIVPKQWQCTGALLLPVVLLLISPYSKINETTAVQQCTLFLLFFFNRHIYFPAELVADFTLSDLLDKPSSQVRPFSPPVRAFIFLAHMVQHPHCSSIFIECC